jgi:viologen exporter family transport system permease protein
MKPYLAILSSRFRSLLQYRAAALAGVGTQLFFGLVRMMIFDAFYRSSGAPQPMTREQAITYIWLGQAFLLLAMLDVDKDIATMIRTGNVAYEMTKPIDLYGLWFMRAFSGRAAPLLMRAVPIFVMAGLFFGLQAPDSVPAVALFAVSLSLALLLAASLVALLTISLLWTISGEGITRLAPAPMFFFSGIVIPLPLFPDWMQQFIAVLPVRGLIDTPLRIYMGHLTGAEALAAMVHQCAWVLVLVLAGRAILSGGLHKLVVQGG